MAARGGKVSDESSPASPRVSVSGDVEVGTYLEIAEAEAMASKAAVTDGGAELVHPTARDAVAILDYGSQ